MAYKSDQKRIDKKRREQIQKVVEAGFDAAKDYVDGWLQPERLRATEYFYGEPFGNEEEGRSQVVMTEVRDVVHAMLPSLLRVFISSERPVEFVPRTEDEVETAEQQTDAIAHIFMAENNGPKILYDVILDALVRKTGIVKWRFDESTRVSEDEYTGIDAEAYALLASDADVEIVEEEQSLTPIEAIDPQTGQPVVTEVPVYDIKIRRTVRTPKYVVESVPPEEFLIHPNARDEDSAPYIGQRQMKTVSDLVAMGFDEATVRKHKGNNDLDMQNVEKQARNPAIASRFAQNTADEATDDVLFVESYVWSDTDGDGVVELHKVCSIGDHHYVLSDEVVSDAPFAIFCPYPEPHAPVGMSVADKVIDVQVIKSNVVRNTLDSLAQSIFPRTAVVEGQVNMDDVLNTEVGAVVRMRAPGMVQPLETPFVGQYALPILGYLDDMRAQRTGISRATQGLDADVLQSTTKSAVTATVSAAQESLEMIARIFAETGMKRLFKGLLKLFIQHQDQPRMMRLRNKWVSVDPRGWDAELDVVVNVGLGNGDRNERTALLVQTAAQQKEILMTLGPENPLVSIEQYRHTLAKVLEINGVKDVSKHYKPVTPETIEAFKQAMAQNQQPDPASMLAEVEREKTLADIEIAKGRLNLDMIKLKLEDDRERDRDEGKMLLEAAKIEAEYGAKVNTEEIKAMQARERMQLDAIMQAAKTQADYEQQAAMTNAQMAQPQPQGMSQ